MVSRPADPDSIKTSKVEYRTNTPPFLEMTTAQLSTMEFRLIPIFIIYLTTFCFKSTRATPLSKRLQSLSEPNLILPLNQTLTAIGRPTDPYEYRLQGSPVMVEYFDYQERRYGMRACLRQAILDLQGRLLANPGLTNALMGSTERSFDGSFEAGSTLFLHPGEHMTWGHWATTIRNLRDVIAPHRRNLDGAGFYFKINVDGMGEIGHGNFTQIPVLGHPGLVTVS